MLCSSSVTFPGIFMRYLLVYTLFCHHARLSCCPFCLSAAVRTERGELTLQPDPLLLHLPVGVPPGLTCHSQSDGRAGWWCVCVCVWLCVCERESIQTFDQWHCTQFLWRIVLFLLSSTLLNTLSSCLVLFFSHKILAGSKSSDI